ncbi:serine/threonine-protein kinase ATM-like [Humulus lupulus]|uniref:serine/threonine-protein kinase ATM-like n=1 Tax=Humulus lupulus TaxID=3486 RepID=UPI002B40EB2F|nr:serine/threonine-protein kinase ATM-like [Humulus lupulus]
MDLAQCFSTIDLLLLKLIYVILCCFLSHFLTSLCSQVFWLSIDYLAVAKSAVLPQHIEILVSAVTHINEPDSLYGIILSNKYKAAWHAGNWNFSLLYMGDNSQSEQN